MESINAIQPAHEDCPICGWDAATVFTQVHEKRCRRWKQAIADMNGYQPTPRPRVEVLIEELTQKLAAADDDVEAVKIAGALMRAHYDRSLGHAIDNGHYKDHPDYDAYASMLDLQGLPEGFRHLYPHQPGHIAPGFGFWEPADSKSRRLQFRAARH